MNKTFFKAIISGIAVSAAVGFMFAAPLAFADDAAITTVPSTTGSDGISNDSVSSTSSTVFVPATSGSDSIGTSTSVSISIPTTSGSDGISSSSTPTVTATSTGSTTIITIPSTSGSDGISTTSDDTSASTTISTSTDDSTSGSNTGIISSFSGSNGGGGFSSGGNGGYIPLALSASTTLSCPLLTSYITTASASTVSSNDIVTLQNFLKVYGGSPTLAVTGTFDQATMNAVKVFQAMYSNDIMKPWGVVTPTGQVYITTLHEINQLACGQILPFSANEQAILIGYKAGATIGTHGQTGGNGTTGPTLGSSADLNSILGATSTSANDSIIGDTAAPDNSALTANVTSSGLSGIGHFFASIFSGIAHFFGKK